MTKQVADLVQGNLISVGDIIFFTFKKHKFRGVIAEHGLVHRTTHNGAVVFPNRCFNSLTQWTETCIQDELQEYHTRYSAWRRVRHELSNKTMDQLYRQIHQERLREQHHLSDVKLHQLVKLQQQESCELKTRLEDAHTALQAWNDWYRQHYGSSPPPVTALPVPPPRPPTTTSHTGFGSTGGCHILHTRLESTHTNDRRSKVETIRYWYRSCIYTRIFYVSRVMALYSDELPVLPSVSKKCFNTE